MFCAHIFKMLYPSLKNYIINESLQVADDG